MRQSTENDAGLIDRLRDLIDAYAEEPHSDDCGMGACVRCVVDEFASVTSPAVGRDPQDSAT